MESNLDRDQVRESERNEGIERMVLDIMLKQNCRRIEELFIVLKKLDRSITSDEIHDAIRSLEEKKIVILSESLIPSSFVHYLKTFRLNPPFWGTLVTTLLAIWIVFALPPQDPWSMARVIFAGAFIILVPGYCLTNLLFGGKRLPIAEKLALSVGLSLAVAALVGMVLNYTFLGVTIETVVAIVASFNVALAAVNAYRDFSERTKMHRMLGLAAESDGKARL